MKLSLFAWPLMLLLVTYSCQTPGPQQTSQSPANQEIGQNPHYDPELAERLGADIYGMRSYMLVMLKTGSNKTQDQDFIGACFRGHLENIQQMVSEGKMIVAGPLGANKAGYRGIFILTTDSEDEARAWLQADPAIKEQLLEAELFTWYGSAALPAYLETAEKIWQQQP